MVNNFTKFGWVILIRNKKTETILSALKQWLTSYLKLKILCTNNSGKFRNKMMENYLKLNNF